MSKHKAPLFRKDAIDHKSPDVFGSIMVPQEKQMAALALVALALALGIICMLVFGEYERKERVAGYVVPSTGLTRVVAPRVGVINAVHVTDDEWVVAGQSLFSISSLRGMATGGNAEAAQVEALKNKQSSLNRRAARENELAEAHSKSTRRRIEESNLQLLAVKNQQDLAAKRTALLEREVIRLESLQGSGHVSLSLLDARRGELLSAQKNVAEFGRERDLLKATISGFEEELELLPLQLSVRQDELYTRALEIERMLTEAEVKRQIVVRAPVSGRVTSLVAFEGQSVTPNQIMLDMLADEERLQAVLLVPSHAAGFVQPGQKVRFRFDAFPHQRFGIYDGLVHSVSRTMLSPGDEVGPLRLQTPAYRVIATLDSNVVIAYGEAIPLQPDLTLQADIVRERMRIIEWIFDPIRAAVSAL